MKGINLQGILLWLLVALLAFAPSVAPAQAVADPKASSTIFEALLADRLGEGRIFIQQSPAILKLVGRPSSALQGAQIRNGYAYLQGYRVQVYSGNLSHSRRIANARESEVRAQFPEQEVQLDYKAPFWRVRVGNFVDIADARELLQELKSAFPSFAKEMYVVRTTVRIQQ